MIGKTISHYKVLEKLGEGGMGVVYKAHDTKLDRFVALKFLPHHLSKTESDKARFLREAKAAAALNHNNVCTIYEIHDEDENPFIVMEYVEGKTLKDIIKDFQKESIPINTVIDYTAQIGEALKTAHSKGIVHRDIKAENIMITETGVVKVMDFGLAKLSGSAQLTIDASTLGTVAYMSPEQIEGKEVDARADIFSFAVVLYEMLSCRMPFKGEYDSATMYAIIHEEPEPIEKHRSDLSSEMLHVLNRALEKNPEERYQSVNDMLIDLKRIVKELNLNKIERPTIVSPAVKKPFWRKPVRQVTVVLSFIIIIMGIVWVLVKDDETYRDKWIAVLPFDPITRALEDTIFCDGFHDALLTQLQKVKDLHVLSRSTMINYRNSGKRPTEIAKELNVRYIVEGTVQRVGNRILISVQLIDGSNDEHIWAENYEEDYFELLTVQREVAQKVARECKVKVTPEELSAMEYEPTRNLEALDYYTKGLWYYLHRSSRDGHQKAVMMLEKAVSLDSSFALAYAKLSEVHTDLSTQGVSESYIKARTALTRAEQIDPDLPEVHSARGRILYMIDGDFSGAIEEFNKADPNNWLNYRHIGYCYFAQEKYDKALDYFLKCNEIEQNNYWVLYDISNIFIAQNNWLETDKYADLLIDKFPDMPLGYERKAAIYTYGYGKIDKARDLLNTAWELVEEQNELIRPLWTVEIYARDYEAAFEINELDPGRGGYPWSKAYTQYLMGKNSEAIDIYDSLRVVYEQKVENSPDNVSARRTLGWIYAHLGRKKEAIDECMKAEELSPGSKRTAKRLAEIYIISGEYDKALEMIKELVDVPGTEVRLWDLKLDPFYDSLRDDPRFKELIR